MKKLSKAQGGSDLPRSHDDVTLERDEEIPMARTVDEIEAEALHLPENDRARVFESLLLSFQVSEDDETARAWAEEAQRRDQAMENGEEGRQC